MPRTVYHTCVNTTKSRIEPSFKRREETNSRASAMAILNSCQHAACAEITNQEEAIDAESAPFVAISFKRQRYQCPLWKTQFSRSMLQKARTLGTEILLGTSRVTLPGTSITKKTLKLFAAMPECKTFLVPEGPSTQQCELAQPSLVHFANICQPQLLSTGVVLITSTNCRTHQRVGLRSECMNTINLFMNTRSGNNFKN